MQKNYNLPTKNLSNIYLPGAISKITAWFGLAGNLLMSAYLILVTFVPGIEKMAIVFSIPGGLLLMAWMVLYTRQLLKLNSAQV
jgi:hypothetical protein